MFNSTPPGHHKSHHTLANTLKYCACKKPLSEVDRFLAAHREYLAQHYAVGDFFASGPQTPRVGGVIMIEAENRTAVDAIIAKDPFNNMIIRV